MQKRRYFFPAVSVLVVFFYLFYWAGGFLPGEGVIVGGLLTMSETTHHMFNAIWWGILVGIFSIGLIGKVPRDLVMAALGRGSSWKGLFRATGAGVLLDLCNHGILMVGVKLYERGASIGQVIAFLLASPWNSFSLTLVLIGLIGLKLTLLFVVLSMVVALITGRIFDILVSAGVLPKNPNSLPETTGKGIKFLPECKKWFWATSFNVAFFRDVIFDGLRSSRMVLKWIFFGILLAGLLRVFLTPGQFEGFFGPSLLGLGATVVFATVLEICSEGSAPVASDIINRADAPGNGFAFLMAGVATDYTEMMILRETTGSWKIALFLPLIAVPQILLLAVLLNAFG